jgi:glycerol-3-phosphate dehydrogenase
MVWVVGGGVFGVALAVVLLHKIVTKKLAKFSLNIFL